MRRWEPLLDAAETDAVTQKRQSTVGSATAVHFRVIEYSPSEAKLFTPVLSPRPPFPSDSPFAPVPSPSRTPWSDLKETRLTSALPAEQWKGQNGRARRIGGKPMKTRRIGRPVEERNPPRTASSCSVSAQASQA